jgi:acyl carrier protein
VKDIADTVIQIVAEQMGVKKSEVTRETRFAEDLACDSLDGVELIMECEDEFDISIPDGDADGIKNVGQAIDYVCRVLSARQQVQ